MAKATTPSFITEIPLHTSSREQAVLKKRFWAAKQQYNALLGEALGRLNAMRSDKCYQEARELYKEGRKKAEAKTLFKQLAKEHAYREYDLYSYCKQWNKKHQPLSIGARISQKLAKRAFQSVKEYELGKRGKPRFKGYRGLSSIEDNSIDANIRLKENAVHYLGLSLPLCYDLKDPIHYHGLNSPIKYIRLIKRRFNGRTRYFAQLVNEGSPWIKRKNLSGKATVGLDIGPQTIAIVSPEKKEAHLKIFADELKPLKKKKKTRQQKLSRQLKSNNPASFEKDQWVKKDKNWQRKQGKPIKGKRLSIRSKSLQKTSAQLADIARREASFRKAQHGNLANQIIRIGNKIKTEKLSYKAFQKLFGSSVGLRAPGMFIETLKRKAENAGGEVIEINTWNTALSQTCHCGRKEKKPLSERWHKCQCGVEAQRDLYSAYLACFVQDNKLMVSQAQKAWEGMDIALHTAMSKLKHASSRHQPASLGLQKLGPERVVCAVS